MKLALGTAQFGLEYGAFGMRKQISEDDVKEILIRAAENGVDVLDTAGLYGNSEVVLGRVNAGERFSIVSKCPPLSSEDDPIRAVRRHADATRANLKVDRLHGYLLHRAEDIRLPGVWEALQELVLRGEASRVGVSAYSYIEVDELCRSYNLGIVQLPANVLDPWFADADLPQEMEVHVRSAFLQGFLLSDPNRLPEKFLPWRRTLETFRCRASELGLSPLKATLAPLLQATSIDKVVVGIDSTAQFNEIIISYKELNQLPRVSLGSYPDANSNLTDPRKW